MSLEVLLIGFHSFEKQMDKKGEVLHSPQTCGGEGHMIQILRRGEKWVDES
jgi:hypothetical protein